MHIGHKGSVVAFAVEFCTNVAQIFSFPQSLCGQTHEISASVNDADALLHARFGVSGQCCGHTLQAQRISSTDVCISHLHSVAISGGVVE